MTYKYPDNVSITGDFKDSYNEILSPEAINFLIELHNKFNTKRIDLLEKRKEREKLINNGHLPDFLTSTSEIRNQDWKVAPVPEDLQNRKVEITGPTDRKMVINALNSGANAYMADFEDSNTPTWSNQLDGQINMRDAVNKSISYINPVNNKSYSLNENVATLLVRPRGWHLEEKHFRVNNTNLSGSLFDFGLYFFHNVQERLKNNSGIYLYLPKLESHLEARLWNDVFVFAQNYLNVPQGTVKATVLIETILATFEMDEILYELREHSAGLNCGRWDYIFSCIKKFRSSPNFVLADRNSVTMTSPFMRAYSLLLIKTCHKRGAFAMGGMAAQIPIKNGEEANKSAMDKVIADKTREATDGHDGTWVAHPGLVPIAKEIFETNISGPNQINKQRDDINVDAKDLLDFKPTSPITESGLRQNISIGIQYIGAWLAGTGCVPIFNLMEDAATAEISRAQIWNWIRSPHGVLDNGENITPELFLKILPEELDKIKIELANSPINGQYDKAAEIFKELTLSEDFVDFLTLPAYEEIN